MAAQLLENSDGVIRGKTALRKYWDEGLRRIPGLRFEVMGIYLGLSTLVINYRNCRRRPVADPVGGVGPGLLAVAQTHARRLRATRRSARLSGFKPASARRPRPSAKRPAHSGCW